MLCLIGGNADAAASSSPAAAFSGVDTVGATIVTARLVLLLAGIDTLGQIRCVPVLLSRGRTMEDGQSPSPVVRAYFATATASFVA